MKPRVVVTDCAFSDPGTERQILTAAIKKLRETASNLALKSVRGEPLDSILNGVKP
ncbi:MAG TPA: hypothetical protein VJA21_10545 [Verrucomicrobiae bacterium]